MPLAAFGVVTAWTAPEQGTVVVLSLVGAEGALGIGCLMAGIQMLQFVFGGTTTHDRIADALLWAGAFVGCGASMTAALGGIMRIYMYPNGFSILETGLMGLAGAGLLATAAVVKKRVL